MCAFLCFSTIPTVFLLLECHGSRLVRVHLEVLEVVDEGRPFVTVGDGASFLHTIGHSRRAAGEHANLWEQDVLFLKAVEELVEVGTTKVGDGAQSGEKTAS